MYKIHVKCMKTVKQSRILDLVLFQIQTNKNVIVMYKKRSITMSLALAVFIVNRMPCFFIWFTPYQRVRVQ